MDKYLKRHRIDSGAGTSRERDRDDPDEEDVSVEDVTVRPKWKSVVWKHFTKLTNPVSNKSEAKCHYCPSVLKVDYGSTTSLARHLEAKHHNEFLTYKSQKESDTAKPKRRKDSKASEEKRQTLEDFGVTKWSPDHPKSKTLTKSVGKWLASSLHPYSLVEEEGLIQTLQLAEPRYKLPSASTFARSVIPGLVEDLRKQIKDDLNSEKPNLTSISLTSDMWTSRSNQSYLSITCHFIQNTEFSIKSLCLGQYSIEGKHTGQIIAKYIESSLDEWQLNDLTIPIFIVTDNAKNITNAVKRTGLVGLTCFAHTLQLVIKAAKSDNAGLSNMAAKARAIVGHFKHSAQDFQKLMKKQRELDLVQKTLLQDVETRWNSEYLMLRRLIELKKPLTLVCLDIEIESFNHTDWQAAQNYVDILEPLAKFTEDVSGNRLSTRSMIIPIIKEIQGHLERYIELHTGQTGVTFAKSLLHQMKSKFPLYSQNNPIDLIATLVDPRFKDVYLNEGERAPAEAALKKEVKNLMKKPVKDSADVPSTSSTSDDCSNTSSSGRWSLLDQLRKERIKSSSKHSRDLEDKEVEEYLAEPIIEISANPLEWWMNNGTRFKNLMLAAKKYLGIPATEVASERVFSTAGNIVSDKRKRLTEEHVEQLVFLGSNSRFLK